eukprot:TRINITY_DN21870_c0_g1_i13.p1 TRINITY_DN21870_c0_g1~~TRINITY_DN21870_c0_g1_i13.p1  ORF type:complete len:494 (-),score=72.13 TRINITY_DN21870_c0_g1_i13:217-1698(-)
MLRSLVGSEMCIRDSINAEYGKPSPTKMKCEITGTSSFLHILIWFPIAYILAWGCVVMNRRYKKVQDFLKESLALSTDGSSSIRISSGPFLDVPEQAFDSDDETVVEAKDGGSLTLPKKHTIYCIGPRTYQWTVLSLQVISSLASLLQGAYVLNVKPDGIVNPQYIGAVWVITGLVWLWSTVVLYLAPASASCSVPIFWTLMFYAQIGAYVSGCGYGSDMDQDQFVRVMELFILAALGLLIVFSWRQFLGLNFVPVLIMIFLGQCSIALFRKIRRQCGESPAEKAKAYEAPLMQNEDEVVDDGETVVELLIYDLWPSFLPLYIGKFLGAYHTGIAANNKSVLSGPLEYTFECPHGVVARKRGKKPSYVQGSNCKALYLGKVAKQLFNDKIALLRDSRRFGRGENYGILSNNCHDFCNQLIEELGLSVKVPLYAESLDKLVGVFVPGGSLQTIEKFIVALEDGCESRTIVLLVVGLSLFAFCVVVPAVVVAIVE